MTQTWLKIRNKLVGLAFPMIFRCDSQRGDLIRIGSSYGGWWVPESLLDGEAVCYLGGVGQDITFDLGLIQRFGCRVVAIDPTPKCIEWVAGLGRLPNEWEFIPLGIGGRARDERFYVPKNAEHVSHSIKNLQSTTDFFVARIEPLAAIAQKLGDQRIDLVKLDIEGAEHEAIERMLSDGLRPRIVCVEYDQPEPISWARRTTGKLRSVGYDLVKVEGFNLTFVLSRS